MVTDGVVDSDPCVDKDAVTDDRYEHDAVSVTINTHHNQCIGKYSDLFGKTMLGSEHVGMLMQLPCRQKQFVSGLAGAAVLYSSAAQNIIPIGGPPYVKQLAHAALAGIAVDLLCRARDIQNGTQEVGKSATYGAMGAMAIKVLYGK